MELPRPTARELALARIGRKESSRADLESWLVKKGVTESEAKETAAQLVSEGWLDDHRYARIMVRHQAARGKGPRYISSKLREKGVKLDPERVREIAEELGLSPELETARAIVERRYPAARTGDRKEAGRAFQALLRRGFSSETARKAIFADEDIP